MSSFQETEVLQNQHLEKLDFNEEERELEEALSLSDLPITTNNDEKDESKLQEENLDFDFDFGLLVGSISTSDGEMCAADEVFSCGQILPYRNSVSSISSRSYSRSKSIEHIGLGSGSSNSSIKNHYSTTNSGSNNSNNIGISTKTVPMTSKTVVQNQFHSYPSPKPQILGSGARISTHTSPIGKKSKMWEVLKLGLIRTPEIELQDLKLRHRTNNYGKSLIIPRTNSTGSNSSSSSSSNNNKVRNYNNNVDDNDRAPKSCTNDGNRISDFVLEIQKSKNQQHLSGNKIRSNRNGGFFKSCKYSIGAISPIATRPNYYYGNKSGYFGTGNNTNKYKISQNNPAIEDKNLAQKQKHQQQHEQSKNIQFRQENYVMSHHQNRTFEWLKNLSHASVLNS